MAQTRAGLRRLLPLAGIVAILALTASAGADGPYTDTTGDSNGAPDIQTVEVTNDDAGQITIRIDVDSLPSPSELITNVFLDTDRNLATGEDGSHGSDYILTFDHADNTLGVGYWDGSNWRNSPSTTASASATATGLTFSINRSELGNTEGFNFWLIMINPSNVAQHDFAPDSQTWGYTVAIKPLIQSVVTVAKPTRPQAGKRFTVKPSGLRVVPAGATLPTPDRYSCTAKLAGRRLAGKGTGSCTWQLPKKAHGKHLAIALTVSYHGAAKTVQLGYRVK